MIPVNTRSELGSEMTTGVAFKRNDRSSNSSSKEKPVGRNSISASISYFKNAVAAQPRRFSKNDSSGKGGSLHGGSIQFEAEALHPQILPIKSELNYIPPIAEDESSIAVYGNATTPNSNGRAIRAAVDAKMALMEVEDL